MSKMLFKVGIICSIYLIILFGVRLLLVEWRTAQIIEELNQNRIVMLSKQIVKVINRAQSLGLDISDIKELPTLLKSIYQSDKTLVDVSIRNTRDEIIVNQGRHNSSNIGENVFSLFHSKIHALDLKKNNSHSKKSGANSQKNYFFFTSDQITYLVTPLYNPGGIYVANLWISFDLKAYRSNLWKILFELIKETLPILLGTVLLLLIIYLFAFKLAVKQSTPQQATPKYKQYLVYLALLIVISSNFIQFGQRAEKLAGKIITEQIADNALALANISSTDIKNILQLGIPTEKLNGITDFLEENLRENAPLAFLGLDISPKSPIIQFSASGAVSKEYHSFSDLSKFYIVHKVKVSEGINLLVGYTKNYLQSQFKNLVLDLIFSVFIAITLANQLMNVFWQKSLIPSIVKRLRSNYQEKNYGLIKKLLLNNSNVERSVTNSFHKNYLKEKIAYQIRLAVLFVCLGDEFLRPFFTTFATSLSDTGGTSFSISLPISAFMLTLMLSQPFAPFLAQRHNIRSTLIILCVLGGICLALTSLSHSVALLTFFRGLSGVFYGLILVLTQLALLRVVPFSQRAYALTGITTTIVAAGIIGPPLGGLLVDFGGARLSFVFCGLLTAAAAVILWKSALSQNFESVSLANKNKKLSQKSFLYQLKTYLEILKRPILVIVVLFAAAPARLAAIAFLLIITPLYFEEINEPVSVIGRVMLLYFLVFLYVAPWVASRSDYTGERKGWIIAGSAISAIACLGPIFDESVMSYAFACAVLGLGQAFMSSPQLALVTATTNNVLDREKSEASLATFRMIERLGSVIAPALLAVAVVHFGYKGSIIGLCLLLIVCTLVLAYNMRHHSKNET